MAKLTGLEGTNGRDIDCLFIEKGSDIKVILNNCYAATTAGNNGALNIYKDDEDNIRCEAMRFCNTLEKKVFKSFQPAINWVDK